MSFQKLQRQLGTPGAIFLGLGSILGTGIFVSLSLAMDKVGPWILLSIIIAGFLALANAMGSANLAAVHPMSGGTYEYGYRFLSPSLGFAAGTLFLAAKSASAATASLGFGTYLINLLGLSVDPIIPALGLLIVIGIVALLGIKRTNTVNVIIVGLTLISLLSFAMVGIILLVTGWSPGPLMESATANLHSWPGFYLFFSATALVFVAFTGYGRIATMGEEVVEPSKTIPRAMVVTLSVTMLLYGLVALALLPFVGVKAIPNLAQASQSMDIPWLTLLISLGALSAMAGVLLNLVLGLSRVVMAMGRRGDLPGFFAKVDTGHSVPRWATLGSMVMIGVLIMIGDLGLTWSFSAFSVLLYYGLTALAVIALPGKLRRYSPLISWLALGACVALAFFVTFEVILWGIGILVGGFVWRTLYRAIAKPQKP